MIPARGRLRPPSIVFWLWSCAAWSTLARPAAAEANSATPRSAAAAEANSATPRSAAAAAAVVAQAQWLEERGQLEQAQELLQRVAEAEPDNELIVLARAKAYLRADNPFWALKVLGAFLERKPTSCAARAMAARVHLTQANIEQAGQMLEGRGCGETDEARLRVALLRLELAELEGDRKKLQAALEDGRSTSRRYEEDDARLLRLLRRYDPFHEPSLAWQLDVGAGFATVGLGGLPIELPTPRTTATTGLVGADVALRWLPWRAHPWRPVAEAELHLVQYLETGAQARSTRQPVWRLGAEIGSGSRRLQLSYAGDLVNLDGGSVYPSESFAHATGHRLEYRFRLDRSFVAYGSFGHRSFWERDRTRFESEQGLAKRFAISDVLNLQLGADLRVYRAEARAYDQFGATGLAALGVAMPKGFALNESVALAYDTFPRSAGYFAATREHRRDVVLRVGVGLRSPEVLGLRLGLDYNYVSRNSRADAYDFADHRAVLSMSWDSDSDRIGVRTIPKTDRVSLPYPDEDAKNAPQKQVDVLDAIERDRSQRRNTSCMK